MTKAVMAALVSLALLAAPAMAADMPKAFKKCKVCHGIPGTGKGKVGPDLATTKYTLEQVTKQVHNGSKWDGKPPKQEKYAKKKMPKQKGLSDADIKAIYDYIQASK